MSGTVYRQGAERVFDEKVREDAQWLAVTSEYLRKLRDGYYKHADIFGQHHSRHSLDMVDAYMFAQLHTWMLTNQILWCQIHARCTPHKDHRVSDNNAVLSGLGNGFHAECWCGLADQDGQLWWDEPLLMFGGARDEKYGSRREESPATKPGEVPLEIGYTAFERTMTHLRMRGYLARWPYEDEWISVLWLPDYQDRLEQTFQRAFGRSVEAR